MATRDYLARVVVVVGIALHVTAVSAFGRECLDPLGNAGGIGPDQRVTLGGDPVGLTPLHGLYRLVPHRSAGLRFITSPVERKDRKIEQLAEALLPQLGLVWLSHPDQVKPDAAEQERVLRLSSALRPVAMVPIGQPVAEPAGQTARRPLSEVTSFVE